MSMEERKKRVKRIKKILIFLLIFFLICPNLLCIYLLVQLHKINNTLSSLEQSVTQEQYDEVENTPEITNAISTEGVFENLENTLGSDNQISDAQAYPGKKLVYLTFDDGPSKYTDEILDILEENKVKATFFVVAKEGYDAAYQRILDDGHTLALHSYSHDYKKVYSDMNAFEEDIESLSDFIYNRTDFRCKYYRFPGGSSETISNLDKDAMIDFLFENDLTYFDWNVSSKDASSVRLSAMTIADNVLDGIEGKSDSVVLMHDAGEKYTTVEALPIILEKLKQEDEVVILPITDGTKPVCHVERSIKTDI